MFSRDTIVSVRLGNKGQATPSLETSKNPAEGRKHCFFGGPVSLALFIYFLNFLMQLGERAEIINYCLQ